MVCFTFAVGLCTFIFGIHQFRTAQIWKRNEFLSKEVSEFLSDKSVLDVLSMLDYSGKEISVGDNTPPIKVYWTANEITSSADRELCIGLDEALRYNSGDRGFSKSETVIRDRIDTYFYYIQRFAIFIHNNLFTATEIRPYLEYHIGLLNGMTKHSQGYHDALYHFLVVYGYDRSIAFLNQFPHVKEIDRYIGEARLLVAHDGRVRSETESGRLV
jgi:hypothetical protein